MNTQNLAKRYYLKPYKDDPGTKSMWVVLTQDKAESLGLCHDEGVQEGFYVIEGTLKTAEGVSYLDIASLTKA
jgi:hypothetical protein